MNPRAAALAAAAARADDGISEVEPGVWLVTDPTATERLLANKAAFAPRADLRTTVTSWGPDGLATWMAVRRAMRPLLSAARADAFTPVIAAEAERITAAWPDVVDAMREAVRLVSAINVRYVLGEAAPAISALVDKELSVASRLWRRRRAQCATYEAIRRHVRTTNTGLPAHLAEHGFDEHAITLSVRTMLLSSHHVPAAALAWCLHELSAHPDVQERARTDVPFCQAVVREVLRLHPPVWQLPRQLAAPVGDLPAGVTVLFSPYLNQRDPGAYAEPDEFRPQRWQSGACPASGSYFPFALGPRFCPGSQLALTELTVILGTVLRSYRLMPHKPAKPSRGILHAPNGLHLRVGP
ncbi:cytochrome P450 [Allokutzneria albata]|uniref:Cytochrome P450 n=1 Tax=Allokutzneria albata TaxID=211114 RepID=A0A1G9V137_ALLAB|nr:cytochrome P450 [Allokutzneria albata]SDM65780.1 Cytochrome P450 [Allokutzneria albata]